MAINSSGKPNHPPDFMAGATCLPASYYTNQARFEQEIECCFRSGWISIATTQQLLSPGEILPVKASLVIHWRNLRVIEENARSDTMDNYAWPFYG